MTKLKTLKDLQEYRLGVKIPVIAKDDLKAEAIKWYKYYLERNCEMGGLRGNFEASWIKHFFNLTEDDLKENKGEMGK